MWHEARRRVVVVVRLHPHLFGARPWYHCTDNILVKTSSVLTAQTVTYLRHTIIFTRTLANLSDQLQLQTTLNILFARELECVFEKSDNE